MSSINVFTLWGAGLMVLGVLLRWRTSRYDLKDKAIASAWQTVRGKRSTAAPTELEQELTDITRQPTLTGKAATVAGKVAGHFMAQAAAVVSLMAVLLGLALALYGIFGR